jgi:anti-sigma factor RsiW
MDTDDADLIALIDEELDEPHARALRERIARDVALRQRYEALSDQRAAFGAAFDAMLPLAPVARLKAFIPPEAAQPRTSRSAGIGLRELAAGLIVGFALATSWFVWRGGEEEDWRTAVANYMALYTNETFAQMPENREAQAQELGAVGARVGAKLTPESVALQGLNLKTAFILAYENRPLAEVVQVDPKGAPVLFCVIADAGPDAPLKSERREGFSLATWSHGGKGYLVIADGPEAQVTDYARALEARF